MQEHEWLTLREAADTLGISEVSARRWVKSGKLEAAQPGRKYLIPRSAVEVLLSPKAPPETEHSSEQEQRLEFLRHIRSLDSEALSNLSEGLDEEFLRVRSEWERAKETGAPEFAALSAQLADIGTRALMASLQMRIADNPDARFEPVQVQTEQQLEALAGVPA